MSKWMRHKARWKNCEECELCETRKKVVILRGKIPCHILFIGEAPGVSEDVIGKPFVGPAGKLLDQLIRDSIPDNYRLAFTNLIACIPLDENGVKVKEPHKEHIEACSTRLQETFDLAKPSAVVMVGKLSEKWVPKLINKLTALRVGIIHPAAILRADVTQKGLVIQQTVVRLSNLCEVMDAKYESGANNA